MRRPFLLALRITLLIAMMTIWVVVMFVIVQAAKQRRPLPVLPRWWKPVGIVGGIALFVAVVGYPALDWFRRRERIVSRRRVRRRRAQGLCVGCGYPLVGNLSGACPECGTKIADQQSIRP